MGTVSAFAGSGHVKTILFYINDLVFINIPPLCCDNYIN